MSLTCYYFFDFHTLQGNYIPVRKTFLESLGLLGHLNQSVYRKHEIQGHLGNQGLKWYNTSSQNG